MADWIPVLTALGGIVLGGVTTFVVQTVLASRQRELGVLEAKRQGLGDFLASAQLTYAATLACYRQSWTGDGWSAECIDGLASISSTELIASLDHLRLLLSAGSLEAAERLVWVVRDGNVARGSISRDDYRAWRTAYWGARHSLIAHARRELGVARDVESPLPGVRELEEERP